MSDWKMTSEEGNVAGGKDLGPNARGLGIEGYCLGWM